MKSFLRVRHFIYDNNSISQVQLLVKSGLSVHASLTGFSLLSLPIFHLQPRMVCCPSLAVLGVSNCGWAVNPSTVRAYSRPADHQTSRPADQQTTRPADHQTSRPADHQTTRPPDQQTSRPADQQTSRPADHQTSRPPDHQTSRPADQQTKKRRLLYRRYTMFMFFVMLLFLKF